MKQLDLKALVLCLFFLMGTGHMQAIIIDGFSYELNNETKTATVTSVTYRDYSGTIVIPPTVTLENTTYSVESIGERAFYLCKNLESVVIPNSVTTIGKQAFGGCTGLTSVTIPNSVISIGEEAFIKCSGLNHIAVQNGNAVYDSRNNCNAIIEKETNKLIVGSNNTIIPNSVTSIGEDAFSYRSGLTSITIPPKLTGIESGAFSGCSGLSSIIVDSSNPVFDSRDNCNAVIRTKFAQVGHGYLNIDPVLIVGCKNTCIPDGVVRIGSDAFNGCNTLCGITLPSTVKCIEQRAFQNCTGLVSVATSEGLTEISKQAFQGCSALKYLAIPSSVTGIVYSGLNLNNLEYLISLSVEPGGAIRTTSYDGSPYKCTLVIPQGTKEIYNAWGWNEDVFSGGIIEISKAVSMISSPTTVRKNYNACLDNIIPATWTISTIDGQDVIADETKLRGLDPESEHNIRLNLIFGNDKQTVYIANQSIKTEKLSLTTLQPKVASPGNVIVAAQSNIEYDGENVGFEWRRTDWTDDFKSNEGAAYLYEGMMEGYIRNLNTEKLWKFRPYYEAKSGERYYGDWMGLDPTNTSYFEPTVHTYASVQVDGNTAQVRGYAMRGSDNTAQQGFKYWKTGAAQVRGAANTVSVPKDAMTVEARGNVIEAALEGLDYSSEYCYVAFVTTTEGETFYGEQQSFQTGANPAGIATAATQQPVETARYDVRGRRLSAPAQGLNIVRMSDGTVRKVFVK